MTTPDTLVMALQSVRDEVIAAGRHESAEVLAAARATADAMMAAARQRARQTTEEALARGRDDAAAYLAIQRSRRAMRARADALRTERAAYDRLRSAALEAVATLRTAPDYPELRRNLVDIARAALGPGATVDDSPDGGVVGNAPGRRLDLSLTALAESAFDAVMDELAEEPWP
jgi:vacuolar-type H+-ATPase subunit E/Vma4